jgi:hypothetical protein
MVRFEPTLLWQLSAWMPAALELKLEDRTVSGLRRCCTVFLFAFPLVATAADTVTVKVGDAAVDGSFIQPYKNKWKLVGTAPDGSVKEMGTWSDDTRVVDLEGRKVLKRRQSWNYGFGIETYINIVEQKTLTPVMSQYVNAGGLYYRFEYARDGKTVRYQRSPQPQGDGSAPVKISSPMEQGELVADMRVFDFNAGMFGLLIAGFPLKAGYSARFPVFNIAEPSKVPAWIDFRVDGKAMVAAGPGKQVEAWQVVANSPATGEVMRFDLVKQPPYIIRLRQEWQGRDWTFEMM